MNAKFKVGDRVVCLDGIRFTITQVASKHMGSADNHLYFGKYTTRSGFYSQELKKLVPTGTLDKKLIKQITTELADLVTRLENFTK